MCSYLRELLVVLFHQCGEDDPDKFTLDQQFEINQEEVITLDLANDHDTGYIEIQVISITDSRCPINANCVRFGEAEVKISVTGLQEIATLVDLCIGDCLHRGKFLETDTVEVNIDNKDYAVILTDVVPYPTTSNQSSPKEAVLRIISL
jgi:hypothetical protein